jgi:hypothetical protein
MLAQWYFTAEQLMFAWYDVAGICLPHNTESMQVTPRNTIHLNTLPVLLYVH